MRDVIMRHIVQEEATSPSKERTIDSSDRTTDKGPRVFAEVRHRRVGVVKVGEHDDPVVREQVWDRVEFGHSGEVGGFDPVGDDTAHSEKSNVRGDDLLPLLLLE